MTLRVRIAAQAATPTQAKASVRRLSLSRVGDFLYYKEEGGSLNVLAFRHASCERQLIL